MPDSTESVTPKEAAQEAISYFKSHADETRAAGLQRYFKDPVNNYGIEYRPYKEWKAEFLARLTDHWTIREAVEFCDTIGKDTHMETRGLGFQVVGAFVEVADPDLLGHVHRWLGEWCGNWGLVDNLAPSVLSPLLREYPELVPEVKEWTSSENQWVRRGAAVGFVSLVDDEGLRDAAYEVATELLDDKEDLIHKAVGWLLREAGKVDRDRLEAYLLDKGPLLPRTTLRYAIEKFPKEDRKRLLEATR